MNRLLLLATVLAVVHANSHSSQDFDIVRKDSSPDYENPLRSSAEDEIVSLPGLNDAINFRQFSGYLRADDKRKPTKFLHYWFVESQSDPSKDPLLLWLNGGPGCSSLGGLFTELGPFQVNNDGKTLKLNEYSWNKMANVIFLESPAGVGFSYTKSLINMPTDDSTAKENYLALKSFMDKFPQYKNRPLYLSGESYAGVYLPTLGVLVNADPDFNLKGIAIGNGYLDARKLISSLIFFNYNHGFVDKNSWDKLSKSCCDGRPPSPSTCNRNLNIECGLISNKIASATMNSGVNPYNIYGKCATGSSSRRRGLIQSGKKSFNRVHVDRAMLNMSLAADSLDKPFHVFNASLVNARLQGPPCVDDHIVADYLNQRSVRRAIHIPEKVKNWDLCNVLVYVVKYPLMEGGLAPQMRELINSKRNLTMLVYNGDIDSVCNFLGDEWFVEDLGRDVVREYSSWKVDKQIAGFVKHYDGITFATVRGSGHMVPGDKPKEALTMIKLFLNAKGHNVFL